MIDSFPETIKKLINGKDFYSEGIGRSGSDIYVFIDSVLKVENSGPSSDNEHYILKTLGGLLPVPKILAFDKKDGKNYLLMSKLTGEMACSKKHISSPKETVLALADGLMLLWNVDTSALSLPDGDKNDLDAARKRIDEGGISAHIDGIGNEEKIYEYLVSNKPSGDMVFSHGDYCLPNVFIENGKVSGFLDLGSAGLSSKWRDIECCLWSMHYNFCELSMMPEEEMREYEKLFFDRLGMEKDEKMIFYYSSFSALF